MSGSGPMRTVPAARYTDPEFLRLEYEHVFQRGWIAVGSLRSVTQAGDYMTLDGLGIAILVLRDGEGTLRAFRNSCRHRGTQLLSGRGRVKAIRCPYHDWKYSLDGRLRHVPGQDGFEPLDKGALGLRPVRVVEWAGFAWITLSDETPDLMGSLNGLDAELAPYRLEEMVPVQEATWTIPCNWKAVLDNATESYHLSRVHGSTVDKHVETRAEFRTYGDHYRLTLEIAGYEWRRHLDRATSRGGPYTDFQMAALHKYVIFPNFLMNVLPYHLTVFQVFPDGPDRCRFFYGFYRRAGGGALEKLRAFGTWAASRYILLEDLRILERFQSGVKAGAGVQHRFHADEVAIAHFHGVLTEWLQSRM